MQRREFHKRSITAAVLGVLAGLAGRWASGGMSAPDESAPVPPPEPDVAAPTAAAAAPAEPARPSIRLGTNLSGMEWARPSLRYGTSNVPNIHFTVPRRAEVAWLAANGFRKNRLPIQWELLQPMLHDTRADDRARALIGEPGAFHPAYESFITGVLDAHAAVGAACIIDCHNYGRYQDFRFQPDGSVIGLTPPANPLARPYTNDNTQVWVRIFAMAPGASLAIAHFVDFWTRVALRWKDHPGLGGYGLMNEPHDLPRPGQIDESSDGAEDLMIWPAYAQAAIDAIRQVDAATPIYVGGNAWSAAMTAGPRYNPGFPLRGERLVYEVHCYLDASSSGKAYDWDGEVQKNRSAGFGDVPITLDTGLDRMKVATQWARAGGMVLALTEIGMPLDDARWSEAFWRAISHTWQQGHEVYSWMGGSHWAARNHAMNHVPGWHQNRTFAPEVAGLMTAAAGAAGDVALFDEGAGWAAPGEPVAVTVFARGFLPRAMELAVSCDGGGTLSKTRLVIPAGANGQDSFVFVPDGPGVATLRCAGDGQMPAPRKVYCIADPVAHAAANLGDAAMALLARYAACKWEMADGYTDYLDGHPADEAEPVRAIADSGFGSRLGNAMEMLNWANLDSPAMGAMPLPVMRAQDGRKHTDHAAAGTWGFWCKKTLPVKEQPRPRNRIPYDLQDPHFVIALVSVAGVAHNGTVFQASLAEKDWFSEIALANSQPQARWRDSQGQEVAITAAARLVPGKPTVLTLAAAADGQQLRVDGAPAAAAQARFAPSGFNQMLIGWGHFAYYPRQGFGGKIWGVIAGRGRPSDPELAVLERYLASLAG